LPPSLLAQLAALTPAQLATLSEGERAEIAAALDAHEAATAPPIRFIDFLTSPEYCNRDPSPMVRAIAEASDGLRPTAIDDATCERYFGCTLDELPKHPSRIVAGQAGGRGGKTSQLGSTKALHAAWTVPLPNLSSNEHAVSLIVSSDLIFARQALTFCVGYVEASPRMRGSIVGKPGTDSLTLRRPDGKLVDVRVRAAGARGKGGRAFTLAGAFLDEAAFFYDENGVVNDLEIVRAVRPRIVPGGQLWMLSTPWIAGVGVLEDELASNWGHHTESLCFRGVPTKALFPGFDPTGEIEAKERREDPENAARELDAIPLTAGTQQFFSREAIEAIFDPSLPQRTPPTPGMDCAVGGDTGFVRNSSSLSIVERIQGEGDGAQPYFRLNLIEERKPVAGMPLQPKAVAHEFADLFVPYGTREFVTDTHEVQEVRDALLEKNCTVVVAPAPEVAFKASRTIIHEGRFRAPLHARLRQQLRGVVAKPMPGGGVRICLPSSRDGSHGDLVSGLVRALWYASLEASDEGGSYRGGRRR
jgi:hypothetical protein